MLEKIEFCENKLNYKDEKCITCFTILKNNRILIVYKSGLIKIYEFEKNVNRNNQDEINLKLLLRLEEDEYCFNYCIELFDGNIAICSEDSTVKIMELFLDEEIEENNKKYKLLQKIEEKRQNPIYIIKELVNHNLVLGCWENILVFQKANEYELINNLIIKDYTFSLIELSPNEIISSHVQTKTLTIHNLDNYEMDIINNIESNENNNIICKYNDKNEIVFVGYNFGINIVSIIKKCLIQKVVLGTIISSLCPMVMNLDLDDGKKEKIFGLLCGEKQKVFGKETNYSYNLLQIVFNLNKKDRGVINDKNNQYIEHTKISKK